MNKFRSITLNIQVLTKLCYIYHNVIGIHGLHGIKELELHLLVITAVLKRKELEAIFGLQQAHGDTSMREKREDKA